MSTWDKREILAIVCRCNCGREPADRPFLEHHDLARALYARATSQVDRAHELQAETNPNQKPLDVASNMVAWYSQEISEHHGRDAEQVACRECGQRLRRRRHPKAGAQEIWSYRLARPDELASGNETS